MIMTLNERARDIFRHIVDAYVETGAPVGSKVLAEKMGLSLSTATIRNVMAELEQTGLLYAPHRSAGRLPTDLGLRFFVDGLLQVGDIDESERNTIDQQLLRKSQTMEQALHQVTSVLSGLSKCAGLVMAPKTGRGFRHIEFVPLSGTQAIVVLVTSDGMVENRVIDIPAGTLSGRLVEAANYLNARLQGKTLDAVQDFIAREYTQDKQELDQLTQNVVEAGIASWANDGDEPVLIVHGQSHLLDDVDAVHDLERVRHLFDALEQKQRFLDLLQSTSHGEGVQVFIGAENNLFHVSGCSMIVSHYKDNQGQVVGALGLVGPVRMNYARLVPMVDYTARLMGKLVEHKFG